MIKDNKEVFFLEDDLLKSQKFDKNVLVCFTTRLSGVSKGSFYANNLAYQVGDKKEDVYENRKLLAQKLNIDLNNFVFAEQTHGINIKKITNKDKSKGVYEFSDGIKDTDCLYTYEKNIPLACFYADCTPIYFYEPNKKLVGIIHAGWQGTAKNIVENVLIKLKEYENIEANNLKFIIGPSIRFDSFEVKEDVLKVFKNKKYTTEHIIKDNKDGSYNIDIVKYNTNALIQNGVSDENIFVCNIDTYKEQDLFSFRRENKTGRMLGVISLC